MEALTLGQLAELETRLRDADSRSNVHIPSNYTETIWALVAMARASLVNREDAERWRWAVTNQDDMACLMTFYPDNDTPDGLTAAVDAARAQSPKD